MLHQRAFLMNTEPSLFAPGTAQKLWSSPHAGALSPDTLSSPVTTEGLAVLHFEVDASQQDCIHAVLVRKDVPLTESSCHHKAPRSPCTLNHRFKRFSRSPGIRANPFHPVDHEELQVGMLLSLGLRSSAVWQ